MIRSVMSSRFRPLSAWANVARISGSWFSPQALWIIAFIAACVGLVVAVVFLIWAVSGFVNLRSIGLSGNVLAGLIIGIVVTTGLGTGLMALVFQSDRDGQDEAVYRASKNADLSLVTSAPTQEVLTTIAMGQAPQALAYVSNAAPTGTGRGLQPGGGLSRTVLSVSDRAGTEGPSPLGVAGQAAHVTLAPPYTS